MSTVSLTTLPSTYYFNPEMMRLMVREFEKFAERVDGGSLCRKLEQQLCDEQGECLDEETYIVLSKWCHTGDRYKSAEHVAQAISLMVYGRIIERHESTLPGYRRSWTLATAPVSEEPPAGEEQP